MHLLTCEDARGAFTYDKLDGRLIWTFKKGRIPAGAVVNSVRNDGYLQVGINRRRYMVHRVIWLHVTGHWPLGLIDHRDGDRKNNLWDNLRDVTKVVNAQNVYKAHSDNKFGLLGVSYIRGRKSKPYRSEIRHQGRQVNLGTFATPESAHAAYLAAKRQLHEGNML